MSETAAASVTAPLLFGRYRVNERLGQTRSAMVYAVTDERLQRPVLLHLLRKELVGQEHPYKRFISEIGQMARRSHPALLEVFDSGEAAGRPFMVTERSPGRPLRGQVPLTPEQALLYLRQISGAIAACQTQRSPAAPLGLYHPPISSTNVLLVDEGQVKLVESWLQPLADVPFDLAHYRAPELSEGHGASPASVVYALGILLFELLTGERPVRGAEAQAVALAHLNAHLPTLRQVRPNLYLPSVEGVLAHALARDPAQRLPDAQAFAAALDSLWRELGAATRSLGPAAGLQMVAQPLPPPVAPVLLGDPAAAELPLPAQIPDRVRRPVTRRGGRGGQGLDPARQRRQSLLRNLVGWLIMMALVVGVAGASYLAVRALAQGLAGIALPTLPLPDLPDMPQAGGLDLPDWLEDLLSGDEIYIVNIVEGLNLRRDPDANDSANIIAVVANGTPVRKLAGPRIEDGVSWLRVRVELDGQPVDGWMAMNYLIPQP